MIALIFAIGGIGGQVNFTEMAGETVAAMKSGARKLTIVPKAMQVAPAADAMQTVAQFCAARGVSLTVPCMSRIGRKAAALSRAGGLLMGKAAQDGFGEVNTYDPTVLAQAFAFVEAAPN